ncbi:MAG: dNTP triphosphohydrolase [Cyclobacteriaceae bacterium]|nr:dNTP triphosphohydrolase [Cyclobacteriaceae bacterium]
MNWEKLLCPVRPGEPVKNKLRIDSRSIFEQDYDRIIFSYPFRCLQDKTQVFPLPKTDFVHTRLTHSLEVSSVGRSLGKRTGAEIVERHPQLRTSGYSGFDFGAIVAAAALAHDIGNPPFGHSGEDAISDYFLTDEFGEKIRTFLNPPEWEDITHFEGNAQGFRLLTRENYQGLKITFATLAAFSKYPRESFFPEKDPGRRSQKKYGFFQSEKDKFIQVAEQTGLISLGKQHAGWVRHPLTFLVEAADDICYSIIDLEDGCNLGLVSIDQTQELLAPILGKKFNRNKFERIGAKREKASVLRALAISKLIEEVSSAFLDVEKEMLEGRFDRALTSVIPSDQALKRIIRISIDHIYQSLPVLEKEAAGFEVLSGLINAYVKAAHDHFITCGNPNRKYSSLIRLFPEDMKNALEANSLYTIIMACLDHITLMTDSTALDTYRMIKGIALPGT